MKKKLLLLVALAYSSIGIWAGRINVYPTTINGASGYAIYGASESDWTAGDLSALLDVSYSGQVYYDGSLVNNLADLVDNIRSAEAIQIGGSNHEALNEDDLKALQYLTGVKYLDMDKATFFVDELNEVKTSALNIWSNAQYISLPYNTSIEDIRGMGARNPNLLAAASVDDVNATEFTGFSFKQAGEIWNICQLGMIDGILTGGHENDNGNTMSKLTLGGELADADVCTVSQNINYPYKDGTGKLYTINGCVYTCQTDYTAPSALVKDQWNNPQSPWAKNKVMEIDYTYAHFANIGDMAVVSKNVTKLSLPTGDWLTEIPAYMFANLYKVTEWTIPNNIVYIHDAAFSSDSNTGELAAINIGNGIKTIGNCAFSQNNNTLIETIHFTPGIEDVKILSSAFQECRGIKHLVLPYGIVSLGEECFYMLHDLQSVHFPSTLVYIGKNCFKETGLTTLTIPKSIKVIDRGAFGLCSITDIYLMAETLEELPYIYGFEFGDVSNHNDAVYYSFGSHSVYANNSSPYVDEKSAYKELSASEAEDKYRWEVSQNTVACLHYNEALRNFIDYNPYYYSDGHATKPVGDALIGKDDTPYPEQLYLTDTYYISDAEEKTLPVCDAGDYDRVSKSAYYDYTQEGTASEYNHGDGSTVVSGYSQGTDQCTSSNLQTGDYYNPETGELVWDNDSYYTNTGTNGEKYIFKVLTKEAWRQFVFKRGDAHHDDIVLKKEYENIWYTMCFPFGLTDEQLEAAFNAYYNIADFSGVEVKKEMRTGIKNVKVEDENGNETVQKQEYQYPFYNLILHFNTIAKAKYYDTQYNEYRRKDGSQGRAETAEGVGYNTYIYIAENGDEYKNIGNSFSTVAYAKDGNKDNGIVYIDGYLASPGHPYMIHPNIGTVKGMPAQACYLTGLNYYPLGKAQILGEFPNKRYSVDINTWDDLCRANARTVNIGTGKGYIGDVVDDRFETEHNFMQKSYYETDPELYSQFPDQTYTFIGNVTQYAEGAPAKPEVSSFTDLYPNGPVKAVKGSEPTSPEATVGARMTEEDKPTAPEQANDPSLDTDTYSTAFQTLYNKPLGWGDLSDQPLGVLIPQKDATYFGANYYEDQQMYYSWNNDLNTYFNTTQSAGFSKSDYETLQALCTEYTNKLTAFSNYSTLKAEYEVAIAAYNANVAAWEKYDADYAAWENFDEAQAEADYQTALATYQKALEDYEDALDDWNTEILSYTKGIPLNSYFLSRRSAEEYYTRFFRNVTKTKKNPWNQYTAIVNPSQDALDGIETLIGGVVTDETSAKGFDFVIDEPFSPFINNVDEQGTDAIEKIVEEAKAKGEKVQYMNVVYSIDGKVMRRDTQSLSGLPTGLYIVNGKKYYVK